MNKKESFLTVALFACIAIMGLNCSKNSVSIENNKHKFASGVVSTGWLDSNITMKDLVLIDVRSAAAFSDGHIPNSVNIPFSVPVSDWLASNTALLVELPEIDTLASILGQKGISINSKVVLIGSNPTNEDPYALAAPTRVALTLAYAGLKNLAILDGGFNKWAAEQRNTTTEITALPTVTFNAKVNSNMFVDINYIKSNKEKATILDARDLNVYTGEVTEPFAGKPGHIPGALSLPAPSMWNSDWTYKSRDQISDMAKSVAGEDKNKEIIIYCGVGGYASTVWMALAQILDYENVKVYDGSAQEWTIENDMVTGN